jgi:antitoxin component of RelBE/YafQ-DinJ toxin-antitoxin module
MTTKLTVSIDPEVIAAAKRFAADHGTSVSRLVETFLDTVTRTPQAASETPVLARLHGSLRDADTADYRDHLARKHS